MHGGKDTTRAPSLTGAELFIHALRLLCHSVFAGKDVVNALSCLFLAVTLSFWQKERSPLGPNQSYTCRFVLCCLPSDESAGLFRWEKDVHQHHYSASFVVLINIPVCGIALA